jgi:lipopolysaccharide biosynthesis protein
MEIEDLRNLLTKVVVANNGNLNHPDVVELSTRLDRLIVDYERLKAASDRHMACTI